MHPVILATAGYTLLLSSVVTLVILSRKAINRCLGSALHVLAMSDILSTAITGILLIYNQYNQGFNGPFGNEVTNNMSNAWMEFVNMNDDAFLGSLRGVQANENEENDPEKTNVCDFKDVTMHYAMFIFPFVNAFVSLLSFSVLSSVDAKYVSTKCGRLIDSGGSCEEAARGRDEKFDKSRKKSEMTVTAFGVTGQWLLPALLTAVLQFAGHENPESMQRSSEMGCVYGMNFPFENCLAIGNATNAWLFNKTEFTTPADNDYLGSIDSSRMSEANSTAEGLEDVVSRVYEIIGSLRNSTAGETESTKSPTFYEAPQLMDITKFMAMMSSTSTEKFHERADDSDSDMSTKTSSSSTPQPAIDPHAELELFESLLKNSSESFNATTDSFGDDQQPDESAPDVPFSSESYEFIDDTGETTAHEETPSDDKIFADIVKKIQAVSTQLRVRDKSPPTRNNIRARSQKHDELSTPTSMPEDDPRVCTKKQCFVSTRFLKIHLLVLVFLVYFLPIFVSAILNTQARYACRNMKEKMVMKAAMGITPESLSQESGSKETGHMSSPSGWFPASVSNENETSGGSLEDLVYSETARASTISSIQIIDKHADDNGALETVNGDMCRVEKLSDLFKTSLLVAVLLWTPMFLEVLAKVFLCVSPDDWLMRSSFLAALLFGTFRNAQNLRIIRAREITQNYKKDNSVCPSS